MLLPYLGHGGEGFLKFQDSEEITNVELADAFEQMWQKRRLALNVINNLTCYMVWLQKFYFIFESYNGLVSLLSFRALII